MAFIDPYTDAILLSQIPVVSLLLFVLIRKPKNFTRHLAFFIGFAAVTDFYIIAIDPSLAAALYTSQGNYGFPLIIAGLSTVMLIVSFIFLRKSQGIGQVG